MMVGRNVVGRDKSLLDVIDEIKGLNADVTSELIGRIIEQLTTVKENIEKREAFQEKIRAGKEEKEKTHVKDVTCMDLPLDWNNAFDSDERTRGLHADSVPDALIICLSTIGRVDIEFISSITGIDYKSVICALKGSIYQNPDTWNECFYKGWETADEYLSGNLKKKWLSATEANNKYDGYFSGNIIAIEKVISPAVATRDIYITLGSPWIPADIIDDFILHLFGDPLSREKNKYRKDQIMECWKTLHDEITGTWEIPGKSRYLSSVAVSRTYGTERMEALYIIEKTLNMKTIAVTDEVRCSANTSGKKTVINKTETVAAIEKQQRIIREFQNWVWTDKSRKERLETIFNNSFGYVRRRVFDGSFLKFPGMSSSIQLYPYQKDAVARIIFTPNTLLAHDVGSGKTLVMVAAGQEMRRMGLSKKNMYVVPNNIVGQWRNIFMMLYPNAELLCVDPKAFTPQKRESVLRQIRDNDYDGIIIAYSCFEQIPLSRDYYIGMLENKKEHVTELLSRKDKATSALKRKKDRIDKAISDMCGALDELYDTVYFDELGITRLFVDEAHNYKNVPFETKSDKILGINNKGSKKCQDMMDKVRVVQKNNSGKGVVFATGTPITNSIADAYIMQQYLQSGELGMLNLQSFDSWIGMFAEKTTEFEIDVDTNSYRLATRFAKFHNLPELTSLLSSVADFHRVDEAAGIPSFEGYHDSVLTKTPEFAAYLDSIASRADDVRNKRVSKTYDNMLKITTDGRKAALDLRLVDQSASFTYSSKVARCSENVAKIYFNTCENRSTQIVFCDTSTPKTGFNIYSELKDRLIASGVPGEKIAFIHDAETDEKRSALFSKVRSGEVRILIGSTFKLGIGVNVQERLIALHHIDVPWRPSDMIQREGRILRQGNLNKKVYIYRYITEGSFDAYSWQLLETKQRFITGLLSGSLNERSGSDIDNTILDYAEVKALAVGNPMIKQRIEAANELSKYKALQRNLVETRVKLEGELFEIPAKKEYQLRLIGDCIKDIAYYSDWKKDNQQLDQKKEIENRKTIRECIDKAVKNNFMTSKEKVLMQYRGFDLILPANMTIEKPYLYLKRNGKYYVELGDTDIGNLIRIDNYLDSLERYLCKLKLTLEKLKDKERDIRTELSKSDSFTEQIEEYKRIVDELDKRLGVDKK